MNIAVIGLGLMGASLARALCGFQDARIIGADIKSDVCRRAVETGVVERAWTSPREAMKDADLIIFCVYGRHIPGLIRDNRDVLRPGLIMADICGVKKRLYSRLSALIPPGVCYIGLHPMAGKERDGFENADPAIYRNSGFIICPESDVPEEALRLMKDLATHIGAARLAVVSADRQDEIIAYTSSLMHIASAALCLDFHPEMTSAFTAGAFRDCTRVADINAEAWTELLLDNRSHALERLEKYMANLDLFRNAFLNSDGEALRALLSAAGDNKRKMLRL